MNSSHVVEDSDTQVDVALVRTFEVLESELHSRAHLHDDLGADEDDCIELARDLQFHTQEFAQQLTDGLEGDPLNLLIPVELMRRAAKYVFPTDKQTPTPLHLQRLETAIVHWNQTLPMTVGRLKVMNRRRLETVLSGAK